MIECCLRELHQRAVADRSNGGRPRLTGQNGHFPHGLARTYLIDDVFILPWATGHDPQASIQENVESVTDLSLAHERLSAGEIDVLELRGDRPERRLVQSPQERR